MRCWAFSQSRAASAQPTISGKSIVRLKTHLLQDHYRATPGALKTSRLPEPGGSPYGNDMLTMTDAAAQAITSLVTKNQMPEGSGLRIAPQSQTTRSEGIGLSIAAAPAAEDTVIETHGAKVFLASTVVFDLAEQELDVEPVDGGDGEQVRFIVTRRGGERPHNRWTQP
jgi:iron-sulfur cluster assembly protein